MDGMNVINLTRADLQIRLDKILAELNVKLEDIKDRADKGTLVGPEWIAWDEIEALDFLLDHDQ